MQKSLPNTKLLSVALGLLITVFVFSDLAYAGGELYQQLNQPVSTTTEQVETPPNLTGYCPIAYFTSPHLPSRFPSGFEGFYTIYLPLLAELKIAALASRSQQQKFQSIPVPFRLHFPMKRDLAPEGPVHS
jgi:hypothetical protein